MQLTVWKMVKGQSKHAAPGVYNPWAPGTVLEPPTLVTEGDFIVVATPVARSVVCRCCCYCCCCCCCLGVFIFLCLLVTAGGFIVLTIPIVWARYSFSLVSTNETSCSFLFIWLLRAALWLSGGQVNVNAGLLGQHSFRPSTKLEADKYEKGH